MEKKKRAPGGGRKKGTPDKIVRHRKKGIIYNVPRIKMTQVMIYVPESDLPKFGETEKIARAKIRVMVQELLTGMLKTE